MPQKGVSNNPKGKPKGTKDKITVQLNEWLERELMVNGDFKHPMTIMLEIANDETVDTKLRLRAARDILPYIRKRMDPVEPLSQINNEILIQAVVNYVGSDNKPILEDNNSGNTYDLSDFPRARIKTVNE